MKKMIGMLAVMLLVASLSFAQTADNANSDRGTGTTTTQNGNNENRGHDWGWLGLLGLVGLMGRRGSKQHTWENTSENDRIVTNIRRAA